MIGGFGLALVVAFSVYLFLSGHGNATPGVPAGQRLHRFVAPLAASDLDLAANVQPRCDPRRPAVHGLNVCDREPIVLAFFVLGSASCVRSVTALQDVSRRFPGRQFAAVAVGGGRAQTERVARSHRWTIPIAYDLTSAVGQLYGVVICPLIEVAGPGGVVERRLIGETWERPARLAAAIAGIP